MKSLRRLCVASLLTLTLSLSVSAGQMSTTVAPPQPATDATVAGEMSTTANPDSAATESEDASVLVSVTETALNALQSVLALL
jgi:hypothetical protein